MIVVLNFKKMLETTDIKIDDTFTFTHENTILKTNDTSLEELIADNLIIH